MRLVEGESEREGRVEVCINKRWGTICYHGWSDEDATTVCRQLGYWEGILCSDSMFDQCLITSIIMKIQDTPTTILEMDINQYICNKSHALAQSSDCWIVPTEQTQTLSAIKIRTVEWFAA